MALERPVLRSERLCIWPFKDVILYLAAAVTKPKLSDD